MSYKKKMVFLMITCLLLLSSGCTDQKDTALPPTDQPSENATNTQVVGEVNETSNVKLKSIEVVEDEGRLQLIITGIEDEITAFMKDFKIEYYDDFNELRFSNYNTQLLPEDSLVSNDHISDITDSGFIKSWYETPSNIDHSVVYSILFNSPITYTVEEQADSGQIVVTIENATENPEDLYVLRSPSFNLRELWPHINETAHLSEALDLELQFRFLKDEDGYFYPINIYKSEAEAEAFKDEILKVYEKNKSGSYTGSYEFVIEKRSDL